MSAQTENHDRCKYDTNSDFSSYTRQVVATADKMFSWNQSDIKLQYKNINW